MRAAGVRELRRTDLPVVAAMFAQYTSGADGPPVPIADYYARHLFDHPGPVLPSYVYEDPSGEVVGYVGARGVRVRLGERHLVMSTAVGMLVRPTARGQGAGSALVKRFLAGPQDLSVVDDAADVTRRLWEGAGGHTCTAESISWRRVLRPGAAAAGSAWWGRRSQAARRAVELLGSPADRAAEAVPALRDRFVPPPSDLSADVLTAERLCRLRAETGPGLRPDHDHAVVEWLFDELDAADRPSRLVRRAVSKAGGESYGWYVMHLGAGGTAQVLGLGAAGPDIGPVLDHALRTAFDHGSTAVEGRVDPGLLPVLRARRCRLEPSIWTLVHSRDPALRDAVVSPAARLTRLDGNWWNGSILWRTAAEHRARFELDEHSPAAVSGPSRRRDRHGRS